MRKAEFRIFSLLLVAALGALAGCGGSVTAGSANSTFAISPSTGAMDTNCTGCNATNARGGSVEQFSANYLGGGVAPVVWSVSGGDAVSGTGTITATGEYTPPSYLTADRVEVVVTATLAADSSSANSTDNSDNGAKASTVLTITPGFLQPLTPENVAVGANGQVTVTGTLAEAGGSTGVRFALANSASGESGGLGRLSESHCQRGGQAFTTCTVIYFAPAMVSTTGVTFVVATVSGSNGALQSSLQSRASAQVLVNSTGIWSNPANHQGPAAGQIELGSSGGNNNDYDTQGNQIVDCCSGTLGALLQDASGRQYLLSNNHVLARSDQAGVGDAIVEPGLIDNNCTPNGVGPGVAPVASLTGWLPLRSRQTNADAAIAQVASRMVTPVGSVLELGSRQADGTLGAAPVGISSTGGKGETAWLGQSVAKSGRTTGLTCASVTVLDLDVKVDYFKDCAETEAYLSKTFTHQMAISGNAFSDAGDSGALVVDAANAEPVGLFFAGGTDVSGVSQSVANPAPELLAELGTQLGAHAGGGANYTFVGGADHAVSCLSYGDSTVAVAQARTLSEAEVARGQQAMSEARMLVNPLTGILGVAAGKSSDHAGEAAILVYVDEKSSATIPATVHGVRTVVISSTASAVASGSAPLTPVKTQGLTAAALSQAESVKQQVAPRLMKRNPGFFGVGVGQSLDNPKEAALVIYVDRRRIPTELPPTVEGERTHYVVMNRLHVTRSYAEPASKLHCLPPPAVGQPLAIRSH